MGRRTVDHLLVGGGIAAAGCAAELRAMGADGSILVVGREPDGPYHRPSVTKGYLQGHETRTETALRTPAWWHDNDIELLTATAVVALDPDARTARLSTGEEVRFGQALLATGAVARRLDIPGAELNGIHYLRTLGDADVLRGNLADAEHVVMVGGSFVACEVAASLTALDKHCTIVMLEEHPLEKAFGATAGRFFRGVLEAHGVEVVGGDAVVRYEGVSGRVRAVRTRLGRKLEADAVVVGVGARPDVALARSAGLQLGESGGARCDAFLRSSHPAVFCAGDVCEYDSVLHRRRLRVEHENVAVEQGSTVARNMLGEQQVHTAVPYCSSDLADWVSLEYVGPAFMWDEEAVRGSIDDGEFSLWYLQGARLVAALMVGRSEDLDAACGLVASHADLSDRRDVLADPDSDLARVAGLAI
jgi:3-phenylpropionate/trans-cinnamate dioxygenase ferredoxin reductase subunit